MAMVRIAEETDYEAIVLRAILERNERQFQDVMRKIKDAVGSLLYRRRIAVYGLAFNAGTADVRNSLAMRLVNGLLRERAFVRAYDPLAVGEARAVLPSETCVDDPYDAVSGAEALVIATEWSEFRELDFAEVLRRMASLVIVDGRNLLPGEEMKRIGFSYWGIDVR